MEELMDSLTTSLNVTSAKDQSTTEWSDDRKQHVRHFQYKLKTNKQSQEERRRMMLQSQKEKRQEYHNNFRMLLNETFSDESCDKEFKHKSLGSTETEILATQNKGPKPFRNQIMLSEWLLEIPEDFEDQWIAVPCPVGKRCLVVASRGSTRIYSKSGFKITEFQSLLPGGHHSSTENSVLDCLWNEHKQSYFVLDVLSWSKLPLVGCEAQFRFYWIESKLKEEPLLEYGSKENNFPFKRLPFVTCTKESLEATMVEILASPLNPLDGILFYHKSGFYTPHVSPLVGWLKPYMLPEILKAKIPEMYLQKMPKGYTSLEQHLKSRSNSKADDSMLVDADVRQ